MNSIEQTMKSKEFEGTFGDILDTQKMGIIIENADISLTDKTDKTRSDS